MPMKGHSERVPNKNLKDFNGFPLYHAVMRTILASAYINEVIINTDSEDMIADLRKYFPTVKIHLRPDEICGDFVSMNDIIRYDMEHSDGDIYIQTHSTNPILSTRTLDDAIEVFNTKKETYDSLFSVTKWQTRLYWEDGQAVNHNPNELLRTQDLPPVFEENSCFFIFTKESFENAGNKRIGAKPLMFPIDKLEAIDIDEPEDFELAQLVDRLRNNK